MITVQTDQQKGNDDNKTPNDQMITTAVSIALQV